MDNLLYRIGNLISIKSLVTLILTIVFAILSVRGQVGETQFLTVFTVVIAFYFGTQAQKNSGTNSNGTSANNHIDTTE